MNRPALQSEQVGVSRLAFRARKVFGTFEKRAPGVCFSSLENFSGPKTIRKTLARLFFKAALFIRCKGNKNQNNCIVSCLEMLSF